MAFTPENKGDVAPCFFCVQLPAMLQSPQYPAPLISSESGLGVLS